MTDVGIIAIGRNEGERLRGCLASVVNRGMPVVYVDSNSTDGSPDLARSMGAEVVALDMSLPFSAARARNEGFARLMQVAPDVRFVQFVDGDCEIVEGWIDRAKQELEQHPDRAVVCGRRRERHPEASVYNRLADLEWDTPIGEAQSCGGDAMFRVEAFQQAGGYDASVVAGEEPELCQRLREKGWKVYRVDAEMTLHDSALMHFSQWWKRAVRSGYGMMDVATRFRRGEDGLFVRDVKNAQHWVNASIVIVFGALPLMLGAILGLVLGRSRTYWTSTLAIAGEGALAVCLLLMAYVAQALRLALKVRRRVPGTRTALAYGVLTMIWKWANYAGQRQYQRDRRAGKNTRLIDYKAAAPAMTLHS